MPILLSQFAATLWSGLPYSQALDYDGTTTLLEMALPGSQKSAPPGLEASMEFNGLFFHDRQVVDKYRVMLLDGVQGADIRDNREANPSDHGETPFDNYLGGRTILISGRVEAHNIGKLRDMQQALRTAFYSMTERPLIFHVGSIQRDVQIFCRMTDKISMPEKQDDTRTFRDFQITMHATDPRYRSILDRVYSALFGLLDDNAAGTVTQWTPTNDAGTASTAPTSNSVTLGLTTGGGVIIVRNDLGYLPGDAQQTVKITTPATITANDAIGLIFKSQDINNFLLCRVLTQTATTAVLDIFKRVGGSFSGLASSAAFAIAASTNYWLQSSIVGNLLTVKIFTTDPSGGGGTQLGTTLSFTLTAGDITQFGVGKTGGVGIRSDSINQYRIDDYRLEPLSLNHQILKPFNAGNFLALPKIRIYGPHTNGVTVRSETLMPDELFTRQIIINGVIPANRYYEYDAKTGTLVDDLGINKFAQLDTTSKQIQLRDGENLITIISATTSGITPRLDVILQDTWI